MATVLDNSIFVRGISPIIIKTVPGEAPAVARDYYAYELSHHAPSRSKLAPLGVSMALPNVARAFSLLGSEFSTPLTTFAVLNRFNYVVGAWSGNDVQTIADDPRVVKIWEDRVDKKILSYTPPDIPYPSASEPYTYSVVSGKNGQRMYFTSLQEVRRLVGADIANKSGYSGQGINAVIADTGGQRHNPMLIKMKKETVIPGVDVDEVGHGSWVASAVGGLRATDYVFSSMNKGKPPVVNEGIAPSVNMMEIKCLGFLIGIGTNSMLLQALHMALLAKADVLNLSWGGPISASAPEDDVFYDAAQVLKDAGTIVCAAIGDSGPSPGTCDTPGALPNVLAVGSVNAVTNDQDMFGDAGYVSGFSSRGPAWSEIRPDTVSYGAIIDGAIGPVLDASYTHIVHNYQALAGTSQSTPVVTGLMAIMKQIYRQKLGHDLVLDEVKAMLSALGHKKTNADGWGMVTFPMIQEWIYLQYGVKI